MNLGLFDTTHVGRKTIRIEEETKRQPRDYWAERRKRCTTSLGAEGHEFKCTNSYEIRKSRVVA